MLRAGLIYIYISKKKKDGLKLRFLKLSDKTLLHSFEEASRLQMNPEFIKLLEKEIDDRGLHLPNTLKQQLERIN